MNYLSVGAFLFAAVGLLGSPGPAIAALLAIGKAKGFGGGFQYYIGLQVGLAVAAAVSATGLVSLLEAIPSLLRVMSIIATIYLVYLAWKIATSPVRIVMVSEGRGPKSYKGSSVSAGFALGVSNPKAYLAFVSLIAGYTLIGSDTRSDSLMKWLLIVVVMIVVDFVWLLVGVVLGKTTLLPSAERGLNLILAAMILVAAMLGFFH